MASERKVKSATFFAGGRTVDNLPATDLFEVAVIGRSNVGKSTFINRITSNSKLARTSSTPGRTQEINLFRLELFGGKKDTGTICLADLPGFGFAKLPKTQREAISQSIVDYLSQRESLRVVCLLNDCRRAPEGDEFAVREICAERDITLLVVLTKTDKLRSGELKSSVREVARAYGLEPEDVILSGEAVPPSVFWSRLTPLIAIKRTSGAGDDTFA